MIVNILRCIIIIIIINRYLVTLLCIRFIVSKQRQQGC